MMSPDDALDALRRLRAMRESGRYTPRDADRLTSLALDAVIAGLSDPPAGHASGPLRLALGRALNPCDRPPFPDRRESPDPHAPTASGVAADPDTPVGPGRRPQCPNETHHTPRHGVPGPPDVESTVPAP